MIGWRNVDRKRWSIQSISKASTDKFHSRAEFIFRQRSVRERSRGNERRRKEVFRQEKKKSFCFFFFPVLFILLLFRARDLGRNPNRYRNRSCLLLKKWRLFRSSEEFSSSRSLFSLLGKSKQLRSTLICCSFV